MKKEHRMSAACKVQLAGLGEEYLYKTISQEEYTQRGQQILDDEVLACTKSCCEARRAELLKQGKKL